MKQILLICVVVALVGCGESAEEKADKANAKAAAAQPKPVKGVPITIDDPIVEKAIREELKKPKGNSLKRIWRR